jgi:transcriptional regulator
MYLPPHFREDDVGQLHAAIAQTGLATLVTTGPEGLIASHVPMLLAAEPAPLGRLVGHVARANPQWQAFDAEAQALAIFLGPDAYVSPSLYATKRETGKVVPTWNYVAVHAYGQLRFVHDPDRLLDLVTGLTVRHESGRAEPWAVGDAPPDFVRAHLKGIVGFELAIERLEGKWKMSQNRPAEDVPGIVAGLAAEGQPPVSRLVAERNGVES